MTTATTEIPQDVIAQQPTPEAIDELASAYLEAKALKAQAVAALEEIEIRAIKLVLTWGSAAKNAEKSRRLEGKLATFTVTKSDTISVQDDRVTDLRDALEANGYGTYFSRLFAVRTKFEIVEGAEAALKTESLPKRLSEKVLNLFGRCIVVTPKKPSLKVVLAKPKKAKKAKKGGN